MLRKRLYVNFWDSWKYWFCYFLGFRIFSVIMYFFRIVFIRNFYFSYLNCIGNKSYKVSVIFLVFNLIKNIIFVFNFDEVLGIRFIFLFCIIRILDKIY